MKPNELKDCRQLKKMNQQEFASWLGCSKHTVASWETGRNTIPVWVAARIRAEKPSINPKLTLEQFQAAQIAATAKGQTLEEWIGDLIKNAILLLILGVAVAVAIA